MWAETVLQGATHDPARPENWLGGESIARLWLKRAQERICLAVRQVSSQRAEACRVFALERVLHAAAVTFGGERSWSSAAVNRSMTFIGPPHLGQRQDGEEFLLPEGCDATCGCGVAPNK